MNPPDSAPSAEGATATTRPAGLVHEISGWRRVVLWPAAMLLKVWGMTLRFEVAPEDLQNVTKRDVPVAFVVWHNRLFLTPEIFRRYRSGRPLVALISASGDGAWLTAFFSLVGMRAARGSSSRLGREAATALVEALRGGHDIGITPDGPRGPCYELKPGVVIVPRRTGAPLLLIGGEFSSAWRLRKSWDRFCLPKPFSRVRLRCELVTAEQFADRDAGMALIRGRMLAINPDAPESPTQADSSDELGRDGHRGA
ncbi:MAG TPA: lysophospholipid acyltransferase family protein [Opitutaceae bacterium]|nr:lysophospholipid acyltransferase family protein [Opitutaceae bacterium]